MAIGGALAESIEQAISQDGKLDQQKFAEMIAFLAAETKINGLADPEKMRAEPWEDVNARLGKLGLFIAPPQLRGLVEQFYGAWWDSMSASQLGTAAGQKPDRYYRGGAGFGIAYNRFASADRGSAIRWCVLTHLADALNGHKVGGGKTMLVSAFGLPTSFIEEIERQADSVINKANQDATAWKAPASLPEMILLDLLRGQHYAHLLLPTTRHEHELNSPLYTQLLEDALADATGKTLETLAAYLVSLAPGYRVRIGTVATDFSYEHDVIALQTPAATALVQSHPGSVLIECKNWKDKKVDAATIGYLHARMLVSGCKLGILVSQDGPTRMKSELGAEEKAGLAMMRRLYHETGNLLLSFNKEDLARIGELRSFRTVLEERAEEFVYGREKA